MCEEKNVKTYFPNETAKALFENAMDNFKNRKLYKGFVEGKDADAVNELLNPLGQYPHAFVLACVMDRQTKAENAWRVPYIISKHLGRFDIDTLSSSEEEIRKIFKEHVTHRLKKEMADYFCSAVKRLQRDYAGDASRIWKDKPSSGLLIYRFLQFEGVGIKIATMATNILMRQFGVELYDRSSIDISPDVHIIRVFQRLGLTSFDEKNEKKYREGTIYMARAIYPDYPGIFDSICWDVGNRFCKAQGQKCKNEKGTCPFFAFCPSRIENE